MKAYSHKVEIWKEIPYLNGLYKISNFGRLKSFAKRKRGKIISGSISRGYNRFYVKSVMKNFFIHRFVAEAFIPNTENKPQINHKDGNKLNNHISNLEWCTQSENQKHCSRTGLRISTLKHKLAVAKAGRERSKKVILYDLNGELKQTFSSGIEAGKYLNIAQTSISRYCLGKRKHNQYIFRYA